MEIRRCRGAYVALWCLALLVTACSPQNPAERAAQRYWAALQTGATAQAYSYLSDADKTYIDEATFASRMRYQLYPHLFFSQYDGLSVLTDPEEVEAGAAAALVTELDQGDPYTTVTARLNVPNYEALGATFEDALSSAPLSTTGEQRLLRALDKLPRLPNAESWHRFRLVQEEGSWRVTYPLWRAEAMLESAKLLAASEQLREAQTLLSDLSDFSAQLEGDARSTLLQTASRGRRMLPYLPKVTLADFKLDSSPTCAERASLRLHNGSFDLRAATVMVEFEMPGGTRHQSFVLGKEAGAIAAGESAYFELCLEPPLGWRGKASAKVSWLDFTEEVYKSPI